MVVGPVPPGVLELESLGADELGPVPSGCVGCVGRPGTVELGVGRGLDVDGPESLGADEPDGPVPVAGVVEVGPVLGADEPGPVPLGADELGELAGVLELELGVVLEVGGNVGHAGAPRRVAVDGERRGGKREPGRHGE